MPETVKLGDRFWMVWKVHELESDDQYAATETVVAMNRAFDNDNEDDAFEAAKTLVRLCLFDDVDEESVEKLTVNDIGDLVNAITDDFDTVPTNT